MTGRTSTVRQALNLALRHALEEDKRVFLIGEDIADPMGGDYKITAGLSTDFGTERVRNTPIVEGGIVGAAIGAALAGMRPVAEIMYVDFATGAMDQIVNQAALLCYMSGGQLAVPIVIRMQGGGRRRSAAQHSKNLEAWFCHIPGLKYVVPGDANEAYWLLRYAIEDPNPVILYEAALLYATESELDLSRPPRALLEPVHLRHGSDVTIVTWGVTRMLAADVAGQLAQEGIAADVLALRQLAPLDCSLVYESVKKTGLLAIVHEAWVACGVGAEIAARVASEVFMYLDGPVLRFGAKHCPHPFAPVLERAMMPSVEEVLKGIRAWFR